MRRGSMPSSWHRLGGSQEHGPCKRATPVAAHAPTMDGQSSDSDSLDRSATDKQWLAAERCRRLKVGNGPKIGPRSDFVVPGQRFIFVRAVILRHLFAIRQVGGGKPRSRAFSSAVPGRVVAGREDRSAPYPGSAQMLDVV